MQKHSEVERLFYRLEQNIRPYDEVVEQYYPIFEDAWQDFEIYKYFTYSDFNKQEAKLRWTEFIKANLVSYEDFSEYFYFKYGFKPLTLSLMFDTDDLNNIFRKKQYGHETGGLFFFPALFGDVDVNRFSSFLKCIGLILVCQDSDLILEHELLHSCHYLYSNNFPLLLSRPYDRYLPLSSNMGIMESRLFDEVFAFQEWDFDSSRKMLSLMDDLYLKKQVEQFREEHSKDKSLSELVYDIMFDNLRKGINEMRFFFNEHRKRFANILFLGEILSREISSTLSDITLWNEISLIESNYSKAKSILKGKGYYY
jgi:hypothetical protein